MARNRYSSGHCLKSLARDGDPIPMANMLVGMLDGLAVQVLVHASSMPRATMRATCMGFIDAVVAAPTAS